MRISDRGECDELELWSRLSALYDAPYVGRKKKHTTTMTENRPVTVLQEEVLWVWVDCSCSWTGSTCSSCVLCSSVIPATHLCYSKAKFSIVHFVIQLEKLKAYNIVQLWSGCKDKNRGSGQLAYVVSKGTRGMISVQRSFGAKRLVFKREYYKHIIKVFTKLKVYILLIRSHRRKLW